MSYGKTLVTAAALVFFGGSVLAQQAMTGTVSKVDEAAGKIAIQEAQGGSAPEEFKVQDGLVFNSVKPGDKVTITVAEVNGLKTITKLEKQ